eukprot:5493474-Amphidinium_carterae.1
MLSGRSTVVASEGGWNVRHVLDDCRRRLGLASNGSTMELWHGSEMVPAARTEVRDWPGIRQCGEISEYQLLLRRNV